MKAILLFWLQWNVRPLLNKLFSLFTVYHGIVSRFVLGTYFYFTHEIPAWLFNCNDFERSQMIIDFEEPNFK